MKAIDPMKSQVFVRGSSHLLDADGWRIIKIENVYGFGIKYGRFVFRIGYDNSPMPKPGIVFRFVFRLNLFGQVYA